MAYKDPQDERLKAARRKHYEANKQAYMDNNKRRKQEMRDYVVSLKNAGCCAKCGVSYPGEPWLLEYDHREREAKTAGISKIISQLSWNKLQEEIAKCDLLCVVCHRRRTAVQLGWGSGNTEAIE